MTRTSTVKAIGQKAWIIASAIFAGLAALVAFLSGTSELADRFFPSRNTEAGEDNRLALSKANETLAGIRVELKNIADVIEYEFIRARETPKASTPLKTATVTAPNGTEPAVNQTGSTPSLSLSNAGIIVTASVDAPPPYAALAAYFSARAQQRFGSLDKYNGLRIDILTVQTNPYVGTGVATCEIEAEVSNRDRKLIYRNIFEGSATRGQPDEIGYRACQSAIDKILARRELNLS